MNCFHYFKRLFPAHEGVVSFIFVTNLLLFTSAYAEVPDISAWLEQMRGDSLALAEGQIQQIETNAQLYSDEKSVIAKRYKTVLSRIAALRDSLAAGFDGLQPGQKKDRLDLALNAIETVSSKVLFPVWAGGEWELSGTCKTPQTGSIACGFYIQRIMEALGFKIETRPGVHMGMLASNEQVWSYAGVYSENLDNYQGLKNYTSKRGYGLFIVGESSNEWGHVLFLLNDSLKGMKYHHAGPSPGKTSVTYDEVENYISEFHKANLIHAVKIDRGFAEKWLTGEAIYPIKTRKYPGETTDPQRIKKVQQELKRLGYYNGKVDCAYGPATRKAIESYQIDHGLPVTKLPDDATKNALSKAENLN